MKKNVIYMAIAIVTSLASIALQALHLPAVLSLLIMFFGCTGYMTHRDYFKHEPTRPMILLQVMLAATVGWLCTLIIKGL